MQKPSKDPKLYALNLLNKRFYSQKNLEQKLSSKNYNPDEIKSTLRFLIDNNFLNDIRFAKMFIKDHQNFHREGKIVINQKLLQKGISRHDIPKAWQEYEQEYENNEFKIILEAARSRLQAYKNLPKEIKTRRLISFLSRKGFNYNSIKETLAILEESD